MLPTIRPNVVQLHPYSPGRPIADVQRELGLSNIIKLASNENPLGPSPKAKEAMQLALEGVHVYPDALSTEACEAIATKLNLERPQVLVGNGSEELIGLIGQTFIGSELDEVIAGDPSFARYATVAGVAPCSFIAVPLDSELRIDLVAVANAITPRTRLIFLASPNNPTGTIFDKAAFESFLATVPDHVVLVLDEAYYEFAKDDPSYPHGLDYLRPNVIVLRTFSKSHGLAGIRAGFMVAAPEVIDAVGRVQAPFAVNNLAQVAIIAALDDEEFLQKTIEHNARGRTQMTKALEQLGYHVYESHANFVLVDVREPAQPVFQALLREGVIVRGGHVLGLPTCLRVSIGTDAEVDRFIAAFSDVMAGRVAS